MAAANVQGKRRSHEGVAQHGCSRYRMPLPCQPMILECLKRETAVVMSSSAAGFFRRCVLQRVDGGATGGDQKKWHGMTWPFHVKYVGWSFQAMEASLPARPGFATPRGSRAGALGRGEWLDGGGCALLSPSPPLVDEPRGGVLAVVCVFVRATARGGEESGLEVAISGGPPAGTPFPVVGTTPPRATAVVVVSRVTRVVRGYLGGSGGRGARCPQWG